jgi:hypothetical protein
MNDKWPEFVTDVEESGRRGIAAAELTGWETVIFEVGDAQDEGVGSSVLSTAALAP